MVKEIKANGRLKLTRIGGYAWNTVEGEGCTVFTRKRRNPARLAPAGESLLARAWRTGRRDRSAKTSNMEVRLDARTTSAEETRALGIEVGDFVAFDPRVEMTNGFVRSRHLDDKACVACIVAAVKALHDAGLQPAQTTYLHISNYEEVGHGVAGHPARGGGAGRGGYGCRRRRPDLGRVPRHACASKTSGGPYHHGLSQRLRSLAEAHAIPYKVDIYPYYGSDGEAFWRAGGDVAVALIGPGVDASHNYERTHLDALLATTQWLVAYLLS